MCVCVCVCVCVCTRARVRAHNVYMSVDNSHSQACDTSYDQNQPANSPKQAGIHLIDHGLKPIGAVHNGILGSINRLSSQRTMPCWELTREIQGGVEVVGWGGARGV